MIHLLSGFAWGLSPFIIMHYTHSAFISLAVPAVAVLVFLLRKP